LLALERFSAALLSSASANHDVLKNCIASNYILKYLKQYNLQGTQTKHHMKEYHIPTFKFWEKK